MPLLPLTVYAECLEESPRCKHQLELKSEGIWFLDIRGLPKHKMSSVTKTQSVECWTCLSWPNSDASRALMSCFRGFLTRQNLSDWPSWCFFWIIYIFDLNPSLLKSCKSLQGPFVGHCSNVCEHTDPSMCLSVLCVCGEWGSDGLTDRAKETAHLVKLTTFPWPSPHGMHSIWEMEQAI